VRRSTGSGFTLLEVLVALAVLAIAMGAIIKTATQSIVNTAHLRDQTLASWVALNKINELLLEPEPWPEKGSLQGNTDLANRTWRWEARFAKTNDPDLRQLEVTVRIAGNAPALSALTAFKAQPPEQSPAENQPSDNLEAEDQAREDPPPSNASRTDPSRPTPR